MTFHVMVLAPTSPNPRITLAIPQGPMYEMTLDGATALVAALNLALKMAVTTPKDTHVH